MKAGAQIITPYGRKETIIRIEYATDGAHLYTAESLKANSWYLADKCYLLG